MFLHRNGILAGLLYQWFGSLEWYELATQYDILISDGPFSMKQKIWLKFQMEINV